MTIAFPELSFSETRPPASAAAPSPRGLAFGPAPAWAQFRAIPPMESFPEEGVVMPLVDRQIHLPTSQTFVRSVKRLNNGQGVQHSAKVEISFDPAVESVTVHSVAVIRNGVRRDISDPTRFRILQRESNLERHVLDGNLLALMVLEGVRVGDLVDVAYTLRESSTVFPGKFSMGHFVRFPLEVEESFLTVWSEPDRPLMADCQGSDLSPQVVDTDDGRVYEWRFPRSRKTEAVAGTPAWHQASPVLWISDFRSWGEVASLTALAWEQAWGGSGRSEDLERCVAALATSAPTPAAIADEVIRFVQNEIRYLSIDEGIGSFVPQAPQVVIERRFGDCKDKSMLLAYFLNRLGIPARPVLVSSTCQHRLAKMLPSPRVFDHVIVAYSIGEKCYFVDATLRGQGGTSRTRVLPRFGYGLVIDAATGALAELPDSSVDAGEIEIKEDFIFGKTGESVDLRVTTTVKGVDADFLRQHLETANRDKLEREFELRYRQYYRDLRSTEAISIDDDPVRNVIRMDQSFSIPEFAPEIAKGGRRVYHFPAHAVEGRLLGCDNLSRREPLGLSFPSKITQLINATFPHRPVIRRLSEVLLEDSAFRFVVDADVAQNTARILFSYANLRDHVPAARLPEYMERLERVHRMLGFNIPVPSRWLRGGFRRAAAMAGGVVLAGLLAGGVRMVVPEKAPRSGWDPGRGGEIARSFVIAEQADPSEALAVGTEMRTAADLLEKYEGIKRPAPLDAAQALILLSPERETVGSFSGSADDVKVTP